MSQTETPKLKVSRRGLELIKSFEGLRRRAEPISDGRWVIGHGHTRSARPGAEVSLEEAELLLLYDLMPVLEAIRGRVSLPLNQHQVDALASFGLSVGLERLLDSDVLVWVNAGEPDDAARALSAHDADGVVLAPDPLARRRAAESALFRHDPAREADLADLLAAPVAVPTAAAAAVPVTASPQDAETPVPPASPQGAGRSDEARALAVAVLLGEAGPEKSVSDRDVDELPVIVPSFGPAAGAAPELLESETDADAEPEPVEDVVPGAANENAALAADAASPEIPSAVGADEGAASEDASEPGEPALTDSDPAPQLLPSDESFDAGVLVLTSPPEVESEPPARDVWPESLRSGPALEEEPLFIEDPALRMGGRPVFMPENFEPERNGRFDWSETGAFLGMGGVGLAAFGAAIVGFRVTTDRPTGAGLDQTTVAAWVLALIGALCVGISSYNLYLRWSRRNDG